MIFSKSIKNFVYVFSCIYKISCMYVYTRYTVHDTRYTIHDIEEFRVYTVTSLVYTPINIDLHNRFCWQNQTHFDSRGCRREMYCSPVPAPASGRSGMNWPLRLHRLSIS